MKKIQAVQSWTNGESVEATIFNMYPIGGVLGSSASFYYALLDDSLVVVAQGNLTMDGQAYQDWGNDDDYAWEYGAGVLKLTITGDYVEVV